MRSVWMTAVATLGLLIAGSAPALAGTIAIGPTDTPGTPSTAAFPSAGQVFFADDVNLASFTVEMAAPAGTTFRAVVMATTAGFPSGPVLWESLDVAGPIAVPTTLVFAPNVALTPGSAYYVGIDLGFLTTTTGGTPTMGFVAPGTYAPFDAVAYDVGLGSWTLAGLGADMTTTIVMNPEPGTLALFGLGLLGFGLTMRRRRRALPAA